MGDKGREKGIGERFQEETKYDPLKLGGHTLDWDSLPEQYKSYENPISIVSLPDPEVSGDRDLWKALQRRRSRRAYESRKVLGKGLLSALLWAAQGATARYGDILFRTAPSAGGLYPVETYLSVRAVEDLKPGIYHFRPRSFDLEFIREGDCSGELAHACLDQSIAADAQVTFMWSAVLARSMWKYRQRAYRYIYLDAGHIAENVYLAAEALGLGVCAIGAFYDDIVNGMIGLDGARETVIYLATAGWTSRDEFG